jgi:hypothetical protein
MIDKKYIEPFQNMFKEQYETVHRLETNKLRNVAKFFAHLLHTDAISWGVSITKILSNNLLLGVRPKKKYVCFRSTDRP